MQIIHKALKLAVIALVLYTPQAWAEAPLGDWLCTGQSPGDNRTYKGYVSVIRSGETYTVMWRFGASTYIGTGIDMGEHFAVSFMKTGSQQAGLALMRKQGTSWQGLWTPMGGQLLGKETWQKMATQSKPKDPAQP